jgi:signal transduction histidine kinase
MLGRVRTFNDDLRAQVDAATAALDARYREVRRLNEELFRLQRELARSERLALAGRVVAEVAHEVGTPLHSVAGHLELLRSELHGTVVSGDVQRRLDIVESQVSRMTEIIARLLDVTRQAPGGAGTVDLDHLVQSTVAVVEPTFAAAGITLVAGCETAMPPVHGQGTQLQQVLMNLITNALQATGRGGRVEVTARRAGAGELAIEVSDTGVGIPAVDRKRIFEPFFTRRDDGGTGLGLFVVDVLVRQHGGRIEVDSDEGRGTTFRVVLPIARSAVAIAPERT